MSAIRPIETSYRGCRFRSRLEARWAVFFSELHIPWHYEPEGFEFAGKRYLPDFWLPDQQLWVEVKPSRPELIDPSGLEKWREFSLALAEHEGDGSVRATMFVGSLPAPDIDLRFGSSRGTHTGWSDKVETKIYGSNGLQPVRPADCGMVKHHGGDHSFVSSCVSSSGDSCCGGFMGIVSECDGRTFVTCQELPRHWGDGIYVPEDDSYRWCACRTGKHFDVQFEGRGARINCGCPGYENGGRGHSADDEQILSAYAAARSHRFGT